MEAVERKLGFDRIREMISDKCATDYAVGRVREEQFSSDADIIRHRLALTDEMRLVLMFEDGFPTSGFIDCLPFLEALAGEGSVIDLHSLGKLRTLLDTLRRLTDFFDGSKSRVYPRLARLASPHQGFPEVRRRLEQILDKTGAVKDTASDALYSLRVQLHEKEGSISKRASALIRRAAQEGLVEADATPVVRDGKILIPVPSAHKRRIPGIIYDESATGKTAFVSPAEIIELENEVAELHFAEKREIYRILSEYTDFLRPYLPDLAEGARFVGETDFLMAKARVALDMRAGMPVLSEDGTFGLRKARHPLLERALAREGREMVPVTIQLDPAHRILLISGPNAGGKSVCLKTAGLLQYMFQWGMLVPTSESSELPVFDRMMVEIGDDQSLENDLSTYSSFLAHMKEMLETADGKTFLLIDEFGSGTEPAAGGAIAEAILSELDRRGSYGVITTHYTNLKLYAASAETGVVNGAMQFDTAALAPLFRLETGLPGNSFAFEMARKMGLPEAVVQDAEKRAGEEYVGMERNLRKIVRGRREIDQKLQRIRHTDKALESLTGRYEKELEDIRTRKKSLIDEARREAESIVREANRQVEKTIRTIKEAQAEKEPTRQAREDLQTFVTALARQKEQEQKEKDEYVERKLAMLRARREREAARKERRADEREREAMRKAEEEKAKMEQFRSAPLHVGEKVRVKENGFVGEVLRTGGRSVTVAIGSITSKMPADHLERITSNEYKSAVKAAPPASSAARLDTSITRRKLDFHPELDVRGERLGEALDKVMRFVDDALMLSVPSVRIIHGKGTGVLREEIQKMLRATAGVASVADEDIRLGGTGVTLVTFD